MKIGVLKLQHLPALLYSHITKHLPKVELEQATEGLDQQSNPPKGFIQKLNITAGLISILVKYLERHVGCVPSSSVKPENCSATF